MYVVSVFLTPATVLVNWRRINRYKWVVPLDRQNGPSPAPRAARPSSRPTFKHAQRPSTIARNTYNKHTVAAGNDNDGVTVVYSWGFGGNGRLGVGDELNRLSPARVELVESAAREANAGASMGMPCRQHPPIVDVKCGWAHTLLLTEAGSVYSFGQGKHGQLGHRNTTDVARPKKIVHWVHERDKNKLQARYDFPCDQ